MSVAELNARLDRIERIIAAIQAIYRCRYDTELIDAQEKLRQALNG